MINEMIPDFVEYIKDNKYRLDYAVKLQNIFEGQLLNYLLEVLKRELSNRAYARIVDRAVPINILTRIVNKLSKLYSLDVSRLSDNEIDQEIIDGVVKDTKLNTTFGLSNKMYNLHQYFALEPFYHAGKLKTRVLDPSQFLVYSDDGVSREMTHFLKYMGSLGGDNQLWFAYSADEFVAFDTEGKTHLEWTEENEGINPLGQIPFIYVNQYSTKLMPTLDSDILEMTLRIPQLLSDLNYAHKFQAHSMMFAIDLVPDSTIDGNPDGFTLFSSKEGENVNGTIDFLKPQVEIEASLKLIISELSLWLETKGIKSGAVGDIEANLSGIAKILDEMDTTSARQEQVDVFAGMEDSYWKLYSIMHNFYLEELDESRGLSEDPLTAIKYAEQKPLEDDKSKIEKIALKLLHGLTSKKRALAEANPELDDDQIEVLIKEISDEKAASTPVPFTAPFKEEEEEE